MHIPQLDQPLVFLLVVLAAFAVIMGRYVLIAGLFDLVFYRWQPEVWAARKISSRSYKKSQFHREVTWSAITALIFALSTAGLILLWQKGFTKIYTDVSDYPLWWLPLSLAIAMFLHETYYYWLHRWMHHPRIFRIVHKVHHDSNITSPWTAFSFHPLEGLLQAVFLPALLMIMPMHLYVIIVQLTIMTLSSVINHLDIEVYPRNFHRHILGRWLIGATHHSLHHKQFRYNFGLYFTFWDKWKRTESPRFFSLFEEKTLANRPTAEAVIEKPSTK